jgi:two-component system copper resistance phosphate regulon response regulator CusR
MNILVIEDEVKTAAYLKKGLEEQGFVVELALTGDLGLERAFASTPDLIILDVMLPGRDGWSVIAELRKAGKKTLALFLTARDTLDDRVKGLDLGADAYLVKPFAFSELIAQVRTLLRRSPQWQEDAQIIQCEDVHIDLHRRLATRSGTKLDLTPKEFSLLALLARRRGQILTRATISELVWNIHYDSGTNSVDVHIRRLRAKVDDPWEKKLIKTIRGLGYTFGDEE